MKTIDPKDFEPAQMHASLTPGEMLRTLRELQELTQKELSALTNISQSNLSAIESGTRNIGRERALVLGRALRVHPAVILFPDFDMRELESVA